MHAYDEIADRLRARFGPPPDVAVVLGSGLGGFATALDAAAGAAYPELGLPGSSVPGHAGRLVVGRCGPRRVAVLAGRVHLYEGHPVGAVVLGVRAMARWGAGGLVMTSAVGGVDPALRPGEVVVVRDHLNLLGRNPLHGPNDDALGPRFPDLTALYTPARRELAHRVAGARLAEGVYAAMPGPSYETPAEIRMLRALGADVVGMSTVPEAIAAGHAGLDVLALAVVSNAAAGLGDEPLRHEDVTRAMGEASARVVALLQGIVTAW